MTRLATALACGLFMAASVASTRQAGMPASTQLTQQSIANALDRASPGSDTNYLLFDAGSDHAIAARWPQLDSPIPVGSLVKPFTALAWFETNGRNYPEFRCRGRAGGCWFPPGHGRIAMPQAIGFSCNAYFRALVSALAPEQVSRLSQRFGIEGPPAAAARNSLFGVGNEWLISPRLLVRAYIELVARADQPGVRELKEGMALSVRKGTAAAAGGAYSSQMLAKTGTAACTHAPKAPGDGFTIVLYPADSPRFALLVRVHGVPGSEAARTAGRLLKIVVRGS